MPQGEQPAFPCARQLAEMPILAFFSQLESVHLGWPEPARDGVGRATLVFVQQACRRRGSDRWLVCRADEDFINLLTPATWTNRRAYIRIVRRHTEPALLRRPIGIRSRGVLASDLPCISLGIGQPRLPWPGRTTLQGTGILITVEIIQRSRTMCGLQVLAMDSSLSLMVQPGCGALSGGDQNSSNACSGSQVVQAFRFPGCEPRRRRSSCLSSRRSGDLPESRSRDWHVRSRRVIPGCISPLKRTRTEFGHNPAAFTVRWLRPNADQDRTG